MIIIMLATIVIALLLWWIFQSLEKSKEAYQALIADCDASDALIDFFVASPHRTAEVCALAQKLIEKRRSTHKHFIATHSYIKDDIVGDMYLDRLAEYYTYSSKRHSSDCQSHQS